ncbi:MAG: hypothetical protein HY394_00590 [Candidatus Diapherotrites archaeon]|nr:hypothetical protein [Candidatus Diapherotrites archaeon]
MKKTRTIFIPLILFAALLFAGCAQASEKTGLLTLSANERVNILDGDRYWSLGAGKTDGITGQPLQDTSTIYPGSFAIRDLWVQKDRLFVDRTGKIGIGTTTPEVKLDIKESDQTYPPLRITNTKNDGYAGLIFGTGSGIQGHMGVAGPNAANETLRNSVYFGSTNADIPTKIATKNADGFTYIRLNSSLNTGMPNHVQRGIYMEDRKQPLTDGNILYSSISVSADRIELRQQGNEQFVAPSGSAGSNDYAGITMENNGASGYVGRKSNIFLDAKQIELGGDVLLSYRGHRPTTGFQVGARNKIVCITPDNKLGVCSTAPNADGTCGCQ